MTSSRRGRPSAGGRGTRRFSEGGNPQGDRLRVRVRTAKGRPLASTRWLERQLNDPYVAAAKREGYRSRAAYKLLELDEKHRLLKPGMVVVDLGAAPGGWTQVAVDKVNAVGDRPGPRGRVVGIDLTEVAPIPGAILLQQDFLAEEAPDQLKAALAGEGEEESERRADPAARDARGDLVSRDARVDLVMSDMAAPATGHPQTDHLRIIGLCEAAAEFARDVLAPGGAFVAKVLRGGTERGLLEQLKRDFAQVRHVKPPASRAGSAEIYVVAQGFRGSRD